MNDLHIPFTWTERRPILLDRFLYLPPCKEEQHDVSLFSISQPLVIEYCSGNGQWILETAKQAPQIQWVAVEKQFKRARTIWRKLMRVSLQNLFIVCGEAYPFSRFYVQNSSVDAVFINFPDPWPKRRHAKHRLIQPAFVQELTRILKPGGAVTLTTDDPSTSERMIAAFSSWKSAFGSPHFVTDWPDYGISTFHALWTQLQRTIRYHRFFKE